MEIAVYALCYLWIGLSTFYLMEKYFGAEEHDPFWAWTLILVWPLQLSLLAVIILFCLPDALSKEARKS